MTATGSSATFGPYVPRLIRGWSDEPDGPRVRALDGSLVSVDISGFTALAERLAVNGKAGAEELVGRISAVFDDLIGVAERHGGDVLKFRGDALLLFFVGDRHAERACGAASDMQWTIEEVGSAAQLGRPGRASDVRRRPLGRMPLLPHRDTPPRADRLRAGSDPGLRARRSRNGRRDRRERRDRGGDRPGLARRRARRRTVDDAAGARREHDPAPARRAGPGPRAVRPCLAPCAPCRRERRGRAPSCRASPS